MKRLSLIGLLLLQVACSNEAPSLEVFTSVQANEIAALEYEKHGEIYNPEAVIPPQCYTKTEGQYNPCYACHQSYKEQDRSNLMNDGGLQGSYDFSDVGLTNSWKNLFIDRSEKIKNISDQEILTYINQNNYSDLITWMKTDEWSGVVPEIKGYEYGDQAFGENGLAKDGSMWVAFNYKPMPSTFWPTNGSTDDVAIRLPKAFYQISSETNIDVYFINLALLEISILDLPHTTTNPINEVELNIDIDLNGVLEEKVTNVVRRPFYVGDANTISLGHMLYPKGTEFIHSVRYLGVNDSGDISVAPRMKELRYMKKHTLYPLSRIRQTYYKESKEKHFENLPRVSDFQDRGIANGFGWMIWGFIEDEKGDLRQQNKEEQFFCAGCHKTIGTTIDHTFSFPRKLTGAKGWGYIDLKVLNDAPNKGESMGEYQTYMSRVSGGDEFRQNSEMLDKWFKKDGSVHHEKIEAISSIYELITPSKQRALDLNKAYKTIVEEQSYIFGREPMLSKSTNIFKEVDADVSPLQKEHRYAWDIRLDWDQ